MRISKSFFFSFCLVFSLILSGCATHETGEKFNASNRKDLEKGMTPKQVKQVMGQKPNNVTHTNGRIGVYSYTYAKASSQANPLSFIPVIGLFFVGSTDTESTSKGLTITFNQNEKVSSWSYSKQ